MIARNTLKTIIGFFGTLVSRYTPLNQPGGQIKDIFNYVAISDHIGTSGQPTAKQFSAIRDAGYELVINLLPASTENSLKDESKIIGSLGMDYVYIPVDFRGPTEENFKYFVKTMQESADRKIWVHCAVNARVSVFVARYRMEILGEDKVIAQKPIQNIWEPFGIWQQFLTKNPD